MKLIRAIKLVVFRNISVFLSKQSDRVMTKFEMEEKIVAMLKTVYDPEIPVNLYDLGLIYKIDVSDKFEVNIEMTLTAPNCPAADFIVEDVRQRVESIDGVIATNINLVFEPTWDQNMKVLVQVRNGYFLVRSGSRKG